MCKLTEALRGAMRDFGLAFDLLGQSESNLLVCCEWFLWMTEDQRKGGGDSENGSTVLWECLKYVVVCLIYSCVRTRGSFSGSNIDLYIPGWHVSILHWFQSQGSALSQLGQATDRLSKLCHEHVRMFACAMRVYKCSAYLSMWLYCAYPICLRGFSGCTHITPCTPFSHRSKWLPLLLLSLPH